MKSIADCAKADPPPGLYHCANDGKALTETEARENYHKFYRGNIPLAEITVLRHPQMRSHWAIFVPEQYRELCEMAEAQIAHEIELLFKVAMDAERTRKQIDV
jgi:hypothetical protein